MTKPGSVLRFCCVLLALAFFLPAPAAAQTAPTSCTTTRQNLFVRDVMFDLYYWYQFLPDVDATRFRSPEEYLDAVRYRPLDETFSYIAPRAAQDAFYSNSEFIGIGVSYGLTAANELRVTQVYPESPAQQGGLARGDRLLAVGGRPVNDLLSSGSLGDAFGAAQEGVSVNLLWEKPDGARTQATLVKRVVKIPTVSDTRVFDVNGVKVGYVFFRNFVEPSFDALDVAVAALKDAGATELVLDLRYNGGGLVSVARHLASLVGGARTAGQTFAEYFHNDRNAFRNEIVTFDAKPNALGLSRLVVITTRASASASELVINSLRPFIPVVVIGDRTYGKPVGQYGVNFCDKVLYPVSFSLRNAAGEGDFFDGFAPTCGAGDDVTHQLGDASEASLAEALRYVRTGSCSAAPTSESSRALAQRRRAELRERGFRQLIGAY